MQRITYAHVCKETPIWILTFKTQYPVRIEKEEEKYYKEEYT